MSKPAAQFPRPRDLGNSFVDRGSAALQESEENAGAAPAREHPPLPDMVFQAITKPPEEPKATASYKHRILNARRLKLASQKLGIAQGELLDQAIETLWPNWKAQFPPDPALD